MNDLKLLVFQQLHYPLILSVLVTLFYGLSLLTQNSYALRFDQSILTWFHHIRTPWLDTYFSSVTWLGSLWLLIPLYLIYTIFTAHTTRQWLKCLPLSFGGVLSPPMH